FSAGGTLSVSVPCSEGHIPPAPAGLVPQIVVKPKRTFESSVLITDSIAVFSVYQEVSVWVSQTGFEERRQWNMLPERSTSRWRASRRSRASRRWPATHRGWWNRRNHLLRRWRRWLWSRSLRSRALRPGPNKTRGNGALSPGGMRRGGNPRGPPKPARGTRP